MIQRGAAALEQTYANAFVGFAASPPGLANMASLVLFFLLVPLVVVSRLIVRRHDLDLCTCRRCRRECGA